MAGSTLRRPGALRAACTRSGVPRYAADWRLYRGRCLRRRCGSRYAVARVSLDFTGHEVDRLATLECVKCGRTWRRIAPPRIASAAGYQSVRLTLILPRDVTRWFSRGRWHRDGDEATVLAEADLSDVDEAARDHRSRQSRRLAAIDRARERKQAAEREAHERTAALLAHLAEVDAARAAAEAEAAEREGAA